MAKFGGSLHFLAVFALVLVCLWIPSSHCAKKPAGLARKEDIPFIKCQVCEKLSSEIFRQVQAKEAEISPKKVSEYQIIEIAENVCNLKKKEADWILKIDIVEKGDKLELVEQDSEGQCNSECKTIERACQEVLGYSDTDAAEYLYKKKPQLGSFVKFVCKDLTDACTSDPPPVPKDRVPGEPFLAKSEKEAEMERLMKSMEGMPGAPGMKMYSREDLMNQNFGDEDADEDDDDEADFPSKLGKVLKQKETKKLDWKERVKKEVFDAGEKLKGHADKVSHRIRQWWRSRTASSKSEL
ncbi:uncharacterized protein LOC127239531 [Andrographis paniculata]|uniref:uncharacterized protein LOC127239531 n=1 Tax=Andrographis paniculata TaxID=175694 RepID=UPI0021E89164|nr:uncharacterized protein LOC127239531 [Andrographis paniculata]